MDNSAVFVQILRVNQDVIKVNRNLAFSNEVGEDVVHHVLECGRGVGHSKEHNRGFK